MTGDIRSAAWAKAYQFVPYKEKGRGIDGADCWGLVTLIYRREMGIKLPSMADEYDGCGEADREHLAALINREKQKNPWRLIGERSEAENERLFVRRLKGLARPFDVIHLAQMGDLSHVGICIGGDAFLHIQKKRNCVMNNFDSERWRGRVAQGALYRHRDVEARG